MAETYQEIGGSAAWRRLSDGACIPHAPGNMDYERALEEIAAGADVLPANPDPDPGPTRDALLREAIESGKAALSGASTLAQVKAVFAATLDGLGQAITGGAP
jgi:hypothetical protein